MSSTDDFKEEDLPHEVQVEIAYEVAKGNAFKKYSQHDFKLGGRSEIKCNAHSDHVKVTIPKHNTMELEIVKLPFRFSLRGFDTNRDLKVKVRKR